MIVHSPLGGPAAGRRVWRGCRGSLAEVATRTARRRPRSPSRGCSISRRSWSRSRAPDGRRRVRSAARAAQLALDDADRDALAAALGRRATPRPAPSARQRDDAEVVLVMGIPGAGKTHDREGATSPAATSGSTATSAAARCATSPTRSTGRWRRRPSRRARQHVPHARDAQRGARGGGVVTALPTRCVWLDIPLDAGAGRTSSNGCSSGYGALPEPDELKRLAKREPGVLAPTSQMRALRELEPPSADEGFASIEVVPFARAAAAPNAAGAVFVAASALDRQGWEDAVARRAPAAPHLVFDWRPDGVAGRPRALADRLVGGGLGPGRARALPPPGRPADLLVPPAAPRPRARVRPGARRRPRPLGVSWARPLRIAPSRRRSAPRSSSPEPPVAGRAAAYSDSPMLDPEPAGRAAPPHHGSPPSVLGGGEGEPHCAADPHDRALEPARVEEHGLRGGDGARIDVHRRIERRRRGARARRPGDGLRRRLRRVRARPPPVVFFLGVTTIARLSQVNWEDATWVQGMNRIRHAYLELAPELEPYFVTSRYDDELGVLHSSIARARVPGPLPGIRRDPRRRRGARLGRRRRRGGDRCARPRRRDGRDDLVRRGRVRPVDGRLRRVRDQDDHDVPAQPRRSVPGTSGGRGALAGRGAPAPANAGRDRERRRQASSAPTASSPMPIQSTESSSAPMAARTRPRARRPRSSRRRCQSPSSGSQSSVCSPAPVGRRDPERLRRPAGRRGRRRPPARSAARPSQIAGHDVVLDVAEVSGDVGRAGDADEHRRARSRCGCAPCRGTCRAPTRRRRRRCRRSRRRSRRSGSRSPRVGDMRKPSSSRWVWSIATSAHPPASSAEGEDRRDAADDEQHDPAAAARLPRLAPRRAAAASVGAAARGAAPLGLRRRPGRGGTAGTRRSSEPTYAATRATQRSSPSTNSKMPGG